jgi:hypothetical protein
VSTPLVYKSIQRSIQRGYVVGALIVNGFNFMHNRHTIGKKCKFFVRISGTVPNDRLVSRVNLRMDLFGVSAIFCLTSSIFSAVLFVGRPLPFLRRTLPVSKNMFTLLYLNSIFPCCQLKRMNHGLLDFFIFDRTELASLTFIPIEEAWILCN